MTCIRFIKDQRLLLLLILFFISNWCTNAQITIGTDEEPVAGALLQLKDKSNVTDGNANANKGLALPRVLLSDKNQLYPMFLSNPADSTSGPNAIYGSDKATLDKTHIGLIVYNLEEDDNKELCLGLNQWDGEQWNCFEQKATAAQFEDVECSDISPYGAYVQGVTVSSDHYISIMVNVKKAGTYSVTITTGNGYNFSVSGVAVAPGVQYLKIPAQGTPVAAGENTIKITGLPIADESCLPTITVSPPTATYAIDCGRIFVNGAYQVDVNLDASNTVSMYVTVTKATANAGNYTITTNTIDGLYFKTSGTFSTTGTYLITLQAYGSVQSSKIKKFTLTTDTADGEATCEFQLQPVIPSKTTYVYGNGIYMITNSYQRSMLQSTANFGKNGTVKYEGFNSVNLVDRGQSNSVMIADLSGSNPPDIIHVTYPMSIDAAGAAAITTYAKNGGVVIITVEDDNAIKNLMNGIFDITNAAATTGGPHNAVFTLPILNEDPIINGPFGNLGGRRFAWDGCCNDYITNIPLDDIVVYSSDNDMSSTNSTEGIVSSFRHKKLNIVFFADGGTLSSDGGTSLVYFPVRVGSSPNYRPLSKSYTIGGTSTATTVDNSFFLCNIMAWALEQSQYYGINSSKYR